MSRAGLPDGRALSVALKAATILLGALGQVLSLARSGFRMFPHFLYYTNISNLLIIVLMLALLWHERDGSREGGRAKPSRALSFLRFPMIAGILLTFVGFSLLLLPRMSRDYLTSPDNLLVHFIVPLLACADFVLTSGPPHGARRSLLQGLLLPALYFLFSIALSLSGVRFAGGSAPYFFLDFQANGWFSAGGGKLGVFWWFFLLLALQLFLSRLLLGLRESYGRQAVG